MASRWRTEYQKASCLTCSWSDSRLTDQLGAAKRHAAKNPTHHVLIDREQSKTIQRGSDAR